MLKCRSVSWVRICELHLRSDYGAAVAARNVVLQPTQRLRSGDPISVPEGCWLLLGGRRRLDTQSHLVACYTISCEQSELELGAQGHDPGTGTICSNSIVPFLLP